MSQVVLHVDKPRKVDIHRKTPNPQGEREEAGGVEIRGWTGRKQRIGSFH